MTILTPPGIHLDDSPRSARLGASEVAAVLGLSRWQTPFDVWARKTGLHTELEDNAATKRGRYLEKGLLDWLRDEVGAKAVVPAGDYRSPWVVDPEVPHLGAHPDCYLEIDGQWEGGEVKTSRRAQDWDRGVPPYYWIQVQVCIRLSGLPSWRLGAFLTFRDEFRTFRIEHEPDVTEEMLARTHEWWERHVLGGEVPEVDGSDAARRWLLSQYPEQRDALREATQEEAALVRELAGVKADLKGWKAEERRLSALLQAAIGDAEGLTLPDGGGKATWKRQSSTRLDQRRLKAEQPAIVTDYTTTTSTRVLRVAVKETP